MKYFLNTGYISCENKSQALSVSSRSTARHCDRTFGSLFAYKTLFAREQPINTVRDYTTYTTNKHYTTLYTSCYASSVARMMCAFGEMERSNDMRQTRRNGTHTHTNTAKDLCGDHQQAAIVDVC